MSRLAVPISRQVLWRTGDVRLWADIDLDLKDGAGGFTSETFRVDTATDVSTFPAYRARQLNLPMPQAPSAGVIHAPTGLQVRSGVLRFRVVGMDATEYAIPCFFLGDPYGAPGPALPRKLLQPFQLLDWFRITLDTQPSTGSLYGEVAIEKK